MVAFGEEKEGPFTQEVFSRIICADCGKKPEDHTFILSGKCHPVIPVVATYYVKTGLLLLSCAECGREAMSIMVARNGTKDN